MLKSSVNVDMRNEMGSNACYRMRSEGSIPGVVYGHHTDARAIELDKKEIDGIIRNYGTNVLMDLAIGQNRETTMIKEVQRDPITNEIIHIDFQQISYGEPIHVTVPIYLKGKDQVESKDGVVQQQLRELDIECLPKYIPESVEIDVSILRPGHPIKVGDMELGEELGIINESQEIVAALTKAVKVIDDEGEEETEIVDQLREE